MKKILFCDMQDISLFGYNDKIIAIPAEFNKKKIMIFYLFS